MSADALDWNVLIEEDLLAGAVSLAAEPGGPLRTVFLTGSYARGTHDPWRPNVNVYFIAEPTRSAEGRWEVGEFWLRLRSLVRGRGAELVVDCHPFTLSFRDPMFAGRPTLTVTSKVLDAAERAHAYLLPPTIGTGWLRNVRLLHGLEEDLEPLHPNPCRDKEWLQALHEALARYKGVLDHLPWAFDWRAAPWLLLDEALRYAEEAIRDGVAVAQTDEEVERAAFLDILFAWKAEAEHYFLERYGPSGVEAVRSVAALKDRARRGPPATPEESLEAWNTALAVWGVVWERYREVAQEICPGEAWRHRVNAFM